MVRIDAQVDCEPVTSVMVNTAVQKNVARDAPHTSTITPQDITFSSTKLSMGQLLVTIMGFGILCFNNIF